MKLAGYCILRSNGSQVEGFWKFNADGSATWNTVSLNNIAGLAIYGDHIEAQKVIDHAPSTCKAGFQGSNVEPLWIGEISKPQQLMSDQDLWQLWERLWNDQGISIEYDEDTHSCLKELIATVQYSAPGYEALQDLVRDKLPPIALSESTGAGCFDRDFVCSDSDTVGELLQTGSVTVEVDGERWVISLQAQKEVP